MKYLSLFSGIGGFELGIQQAYENNLRRTQQELDKQDGNIKGGSGEPARVVCIGYSELDFEIKNGKKSKVWAKDIYKKHFNHKDYNDITKINAKELPDFDLFVGGFPCQAFSIAGKRGGFDDTRGTLFFDCARILKEKQPRNFILENVKGLLSHDNGRTFATIINTLTELGYCVEWQVLNAKNFGVPQNRERVFIVGHLGGIPERKVFPIGESNELCSNSNSPKRQGGSVRPDPALSEFASRWRETKNYLIKNRRQSGEIRRYDDVSETVSATYGTGGGNTPIVMPAIRRLTPLECERLMAYPDGWTEGLSDTQRYKTLGNGIVSNVVAEVVKRLIT